MKPISLFAAAALALAAAPALASDLSIESCETVSRFDAIPTRVVTLNQQSTEIMLTLGLEGHLVGTAYLDDAIPQRWKTAYDAVPVLAEQYPAREVVLVQNPDFLFAGFNSAFGEKALGAQQEWNALGIGTYLVNAECRNLHPANVKLTTEPLFTDIERIGALFDAGDKAAAVAADIRTRLDAVAGANPGKGRRAFLFDSGTETAFSAGCCGAPGLLLDAVGLDNIAANVEGRWADLAWEAVVAGNPEVIVLIEADWSTAAEKIAFLKADPVLSTLDAVQDERFVTVPFSSTVLGVRFVEGVEELGADLAALD
ncbi:ABC transporter substrate-binding protein [Devosia sp.]|uniref:ABC transporter substrate-binding protein n=1 Tax=Devosia sp. TaxID=1871048 RepID=UPI002AFF206E|nr:ABC transporter substrate-binding protein [Devosia sp.]